MLISSHRKARFLLPACLCALSLAALAAPAANRRAAMDLVRQAAVAFGKADMNRVLLLCRRATALDPSYPRSYTWIGAALQRKGDRAGACAAFTRVVQLAPAGEDANRARRGLLELSCGDGPAVRTTLQARWNTAHTQTALAFGQDDSLLLGGGRDGAWRMWNVSTNALQQLRNGDGFEVGAVDSGRSISVSGSGSGRLRIYNLVTGKPATEVDGRSPIRDLSLAASETTVAIARADGSIETFNTSSGVRVRTYDSGATSAYAVRFSPDARLLACSAGGEVRVFEAATGRLLRRLATGSLPASALEWSPDASLLTAAIGSTIRVWNIPRNQFVRDLRGHTLAVTKLSFSRNNLLASGGFDPQIRFWEAASGVRRGTLDIPGGSLAAMRFGRTDSLLAISNSSNFVWIWGIR